MPGTTPAQQLFQCAAINADAAGRVYTINAATGTCSCHVAAAHGVCAHLFAAAALPHVALAEQLLQLSTVDALSASELLQHGMPSAEGEGAPLRVERARRLQQREGGSDPLGSHWREELQQLELLRLRRPAWEQPTEVQATLAECDRLKACVKQLAAEGAAELSTLLAPLITRAQQLHPTLQPTTKAAGKQERRQRARRHGSDRVQKALHPNRRGQPARKRATQASGNGAGPSGSANAGPSGSGGGSDEESSSSDEETLAARAERLQVGAATSSSSDEEEVLTARLLRLSFTNTRYHYRLPRGMDGLRRGPSSSGGVRKKRRIDAP
jgi:hypothetical protein